MPDDMIGYIRSIAGAIRFYTCFISYPEADDAISKRLHDDLQREGVRCWRWREDAKWVTDIREDVDRAVRIYDKLVVILSEDSLKSPAVVEEIERALAKEDRLFKDYGLKKDVLFPIKIDDAVLDWSLALADRVKGKWIGDFTKCASGRSKKYSESLKRLIAALQRDDDPSGNDDD